MPVYEYKALDARGKNISGIIDSESMTSARNKLRGRSLYPVTISEAVSDKSVKGKHIKLKGFTGFSRIRPADVTMMTRQLSTLVGAGFPLVNALNALIPQIKSDVLKKNLTQVRTAVEEGSSFADALAGFPGIFSDIYINMVRAGESSGTLEIVLERLADLSENREALKNKIRAAMAYPILMSGIGVVVLIFLMTVIVPNITSIFEDMNQVLPAPTRFLIGASDFIKSWYLLIIVFAALIPAGIRILKSSEKGLLLWDRAMLNLPGVGTLIRKMAVARFSRTLGSLLENGVPILAALDIVKNIVGNAIIADAVERASVDVEQGRGLARSFDSSGVFPDIAIQMIRVGGQSGKLEEMLGKIADIFENEVETSIVGLTSLLEPVIILVMGLIVGAIVLSICLPIFEMNQLVR